MGGFCSEVALRNEFGECVRGEGGVLNGCVCVSPNCLKGLLFQLTVAVVVFLFYTAPPRHETWQPRSSAEDIVVRMDG